MSRPDHIKDAIDRAYTLESLLRVAALAMEGEQVAGAGRFEHVGGGSVLAMAADIAAEIVTELEVASK